MNNLGNCPLCGADLTEQIKEHIYAGRYTIESVCDSCGKPIWIEYSVWVDCEIRSTAIEPEEMEET